jgi:hypothetical protein
MPMAGCMRRSRHKQMSKWERESAFRARSVVKEELSLRLRAGGTLYSYLVRLPCGSTALHKASVDYHHPYHPVPPITASGKNELLPRDAEGT